MTLTGKAAIVTGAGVGIGRATALEMARQGAKVLVAERDVASGEKTRDDIVQNGGVAVFARVDVAVTDDLAVMVAETLRAFGKIDVLVNNAGIGERIKPQDFKSIADMPPDAWDELMSVNLRGVFMACRAVVPEMIKNGGGSIINISSIAGLRTGCGGLAYTTAKHGVIGFTKALAHFDGPHGIRANVICPGYIDTPLIARQLATPGSPVQNKLAAIPAKRVGTAEEVAKVIAFLASDAASYMDGAVVSVDGGMAI